MGAVVGGLWWAAFVAPWLALAWLWRQAGGLERLLHVDASEERRLRQEWMMWRLGALTFLVVWAALTCLAAVSFLALHSAIHADPPGDFPPNPDFTLMLMTAFAAAAGPALVASLLPYAVRRHWRKRRDPHAQDSDGLSLASAARRIVAAAGLTTAVAVGEGLLATVAPWRLFGA